MDLTSFERIVADGYLDDIESLPLADLRARRAECQAVEDSLSYLRRLVQGRLDIVHAEIDRRASGAPSDLASLVAALPSILSSHVAGGSGNRLTLAQAPVDDPTMTAELDTCCPPERLGELPSLPPDTLDTIAADLTALERVVSVRRRQSFDRLDALSGELARRYRTGEATVDSLLN